jgi:L-ascorbate metabolism protein UlaG (beta-lactamase superfamily)
VKARHDFALEPTPDAVGYVVGQGDVSIYHSGDTEYDSEIVADTPRPTVSLIAINGRPARAVQSPRSESTGAVRWRL